MSDAKDIYIPTNQLDRDLHGLDWALPPAEGLAVNTTLMTEVGGILGFDSVRFFPYSSSGAKRNNDITTEEIKLLKIPLQVLLTDCDVHAAGENLDDDPGGHSALASRLNKEAREWLLKAIGLDTRGIPEARRPLPGFLYGIGALAASKLIDNKFAVLPSSLEKQVSRLMMRLTLNSAHLIPGKFGRSLMRLSPEREKQIHVAQALRVTRPIIIGTDEDKFKAAHIGTSRAEPVQLPKQREA